MIQEVSSEDINAPFKGAFFIHNEKQIRTEVKIFNPKGKSLFKSNDHEGIFDFNCSTGGQYQIVVLNKEVSLEFFFFFEFNYEEKFTREKILKSL